jgi:hypothetical protein
VLNGLPDSGDILKEFAGNLAPAREPLKAGDVQRRIPLFNREKIEIAASSHTVSSDNPSAYDDALLAFMEKH